MKKPKKTPDDSDYDSNASSDDEDPFADLPMEHSALYHTVFYAFKVHRPPLARTCTRVVLSTWFTNHTCLGGLSCTAVKTARWPVCRR